MRAHKNVHMNQCVFMLTLIYICVSYAYDGRHLYVEVVIYIWRSSFINAACRMHMVVFIYKCSLSYVYGGCRQLVYVCERDTYTIAN